MFQRPSRLGKQQAHLAVAHSELDHEIDRDAEMFRELEELMPDFLRDLHDTLVEIPLVRHLMITDTETKEFAGRA